VLHALPICLMPIAYAAECMLRNGRRVVLLHGLLAFVFNVFVLALSISIVGDLIGQNGEPFAATPVWPRLEVP
jgi:hypothetical protein